MIINALEPTPVPGDSYSNVEYRSANIGYSGIKVKMEFTPMICVDGEWKEVYKGCFPTNVVILQSMDMEVKSNITPDGKSTQRTFSMTGVLEHMEQQ